MSDSKEQKVHPDVWKTIVARYPNKFTPRLIFQKDGKWVWQASKKTQIDVTNWLIYWTVNGKQKLMTMDEFDC